MKEFARSAAGVQSPKSHTLRTKAALKRTVHYLLTDIVRDDRRPFNVAYDFIFDRLRSVRQEIVMQDFDALVTIELMEPMIMFLAYSSYRFVLFIAFYIGMKIRSAFISEWIVFFRLVEETIDRFDPKICHQHLQECLKKVLRCYDVVYESIYVNDEAKIASNHREFVESLYLLFNLGSGEALARAIRIPQQFKWAKF